MDAVELAQQILAEIKNKERDVISPGNLQWVIITQQEAENLGLNKSDWNPHIELSQLKKIAG